jgi:two-component system response regulator CpxR
MAIVTIFGGTYCKDDEVTGGVVAELGYSRVDQELFEETSRRHGAPRDQLERSLFGREPLLNKFTHEHEKNLAYLRLVLADSIQPDNVVIRGCAGHLLPRTMAHVLRVCLVAGREFRVQEAARIAGASDKDAGRAVEEDERRNHACTEHLLGKPAYDKDLYDLVLPMHERSVDEAVAEICMLARSEPLRTTDRCRWAAEDFLLSARVGLALAEAGLSADVHSERGQVILSINRFVVRLGRYTDRLVETAGAVPGVVGVSTRLGPRYRPESTQPWSNVGEPPKVMLVDDEKEFVHTLSERLRTRDLESSIAYDGEQALAMLDEEEADVIVLDLMMPGIDGIETLRRIKRDHPHVEVIILTGHGSDREKQEAEELGAHAYLRKPVDIDILARVMREAYARTGEPTSGAEDPPRNRRDDST